MHFYFVFLFFEATRQREITRVVTLTAITTGRVLWYSGIVLMGAQFKIAIVIMIVRMFPFKVRRTQRTISLLQLGVERGMGGAKAATGSGRAHPPA